jgi:ribosomal protein L37AE/L43A
MKENKWLKKRPEYEPVVRDIHILFQRGESKEKICRYVNERYKLDRTLKRHHINRILTDPVYVGRPRYGEAEVCDLSLKFIDEETFRKTQRILEKRRGKRKRKIDVEELTREYGIHYAERCLPIAVICKNCGTPMVKNGTKEIKGVYRNNYLCPKCGKQQTVPTAHQFDHFKSAKPFYCSNCGTPDDFEEERIGGWFKVTCRVCKYKFKTDRSVNKFLRFTKKRKKRRKLVFDDDQSKLDDFEVKD